MEIYQLIQIIFTVISALVLALCGVSTGKRYFVKSEKNAVKTVAFIIAFTVSVFVTEQNYLIGAFLRQMICAFFLSAYFKGGKWEKIGLFTAYSAACEFTANAIGAAGSIFDIMFSKLFQYDRIDGDIFSFAGIVLSAIFMKLLFTRSKLSEGSFLRGGEKILFVSSLLLLVLTDVCGYGITKGVAMVYQGAGNTMYDEIFTHIEYLVLALLCLVICVSLMFGINRIIGYVMTNSVYETEIGHYKAMSEQYKNQVNVRHDMKNHLISLSALANDGEYEKLKSYLSTIIDEGLRDKYIETGNSVIDSVINVKRQLASNKSISFDCDINLSKPIITDEYDLCVIIGNILDNAISSAELADTDKYVRVRAEIVKNNLIFDVKNSVRAGELPDKFDIKYYGTGLRNICKILERQNGIMDIETSEKLFDISVMLPLKT